MQTSGATSEHRICPASTVHALAPSLSQQISTLVCRWCTEMYMPQERDGSEFHCSHTVQQTDYKYGGNHAVTLPW